ncbi:MAG: LemA family protein [Methanomassiliicoccales archaeon]
MNKKIFVVVLIVGILLVFGLLTILSYNGMVSKDQAVSQKASEIKNRYVTKISIITQLQQQTNLSLAYESSLLTNITQLRTRWMEAFQSGASDEQLINISEQLDQKFYTILVSWENYPVLTGTDVIRSLMGEITFQEERLSYARAQYNGAVRDYNAYIKSFPNNLLAGTFGFKEKPYWGSNFPEDVTGL